MEVRMTLLQLIIIITSFLFIIFSLDAYMRGRVNLVHMIIFLWWIGAIGVFTFYPSVLDRFGAFFGVARGADAVVYIGIIFLSYMYFQLLHSHTKDTQHLTRFCTHDAIRQFEQAGWVAKLMSNATATPMSHTTPSNTSASTRVNRWFLIRAYNEEKTIGLVINEIISRGYQTIVVVNDGSKDTTSSIVREIQKQHPTVRIILLEHLINRGWWAANKTIFTFARTYAQQLGIERWITVDADGQMSLDDLETFAQYMDHKQYDVLLWSRFVPGGSAENIPLMRGVILWWGKIITKLFNGIRLTDGHNGYRVWHHSAIKHLEITSDGMLYANEVNESIRKHDLRYTEIPVHIVYTEYSLGKGQKNKNALRILGELIYKKLFFR
jgi:polyprenyl-phospho-N-acetylgalactosaminyl synthase